MSIGPQCTKSMVTMLMQVDLTADRRSPAAPDGASHVLTVPGIAGDLGTERHLHLHICVGL
jgi:hypothetical protein